MPLNIEGRARNAMKHPKVHTTASTVKDYPALNVNSAQDKKLCIGSIGG